MIVALLEAYLKQKQNVPFGPADINGSFNSLYNRNLIVPKAVTVKGNSDKIPAVKIWIFATDISEKTISKYLKIATMGLLL